MTHTQMFQVNARERKMMNLFLHCKRDDNGSSRVRFAALPCSCAEEPGLSLPAQLVQYIFM